MFKRYFYNTIRAAILGSGNGLLRDFLSVKGELYKVLNSVTSIGGVRRCEFILVLLYHTKKATSRMVFFLVVLGSMLTRTRFPCVLAFLSRLTVSISFRFPGVEAVSPVSSGFIVSHQKTPLSRALAHSSLSICLARLCRQIGDRGYHPFQHTA